MTSRIISIMIIWRRRCTRTRARRLTSSRSRKTYVWYYNPTPCVLYIHLLYQHDTNQPTTSIETCVCLLWLKVLAETFHMNVNVNDMTWIIIGVDAVSCRCSMCVCDMHAWMHHRSMSVSGMYVCAVSVLSVWWKHSLKSKTIDNTF